VPLVHDNGDARTEAYCIRGTSPPDSHNSATDTPPEPEPDTIALDNSSMLFDIEKQGSAGPMGDRLKELLEGFMKD
jgi:hypothetical protein